MSIHKYISIVTTAISVRSAYTKLFFLLAAICIASGPLDAQHKHDEVMITNVNDLKFAGTVIEESENEILLALKSINDTIRFERSTIHQIEVRKVNAEPQHNSPFDSEIVNSEIVITTKDHGYFRGIVVAEDSKQVFLALKGIEETISLNWSSVEHWEILSHSLNPNAGLSDTRYVTIITEDDSRFNGTIVGEDAAQIFFALKSIEDTITLKKDIIESIDEYDPQRKFKDRFRNSSRRNNKVKTFTYKNGSIFRGNVLSETDSLIFLKMDTWRETITLRKNLLAKRAKADSSYVLRKGRYHKKAGILNSIDLLMSYGWDESANQIHYMRYNLIKPRVGVGAGIGYQHITLSRQNLNFFEVFAYGKLYATKGWGRIYFDSKLGVSIPLAETSATLGPKFQPSIGIEFASKRKGRLSLSFSQLFHYTKVTTRNRSVDGDFTVKQLFNRRSLGIGVIF